MATLVAATTPLSCMRSGLSIAVVMKIPRSQMPSIGWKRTFLVLVETGFQADRPRICKNDKPHRGPNFGPEVRFSRPIQGAVFSTMSVDESFEKRR